MKICIPVLEEKGLSSKVSEHFGSAPLFVIVDTDTKDCHFITNTNQHHSHGMCQPLSVIAGEVFDGIIVGGIGMGALNKLNHAGKKVMKTTASDVNGVIEAVKNNDLKEVTAQNACSSHSCS